MNKHSLIAGVVALSLGAGTVYAQSTTPPERMTGASTMDNPATATTPQPGSAAANSTPGTTSPAAPALGSPGATTQSNATSQGAPVAGANSFTEGEAKSRIQNQGLGQVSDLKLDNQGVWRGKATKDGKTVTVALDYQGNVVAQ